MITYLVKGNPDEQRLLKALHEMQRKHAAKPCPECGEIAPAGELEEHGVCEKCALAHLET